MSDAMNRKAMLTDVIIGQDAAKMGFTQLLAVLNAIERLAGGADAEIAALAKLGAALAIEFADEAQSNRDEYARLLENEGGIHG